MKFFLFLTLLFDYLLAVYSAKSNCWKSIIDSGYQCCEEGCTVVQTDINGDWGIENNELCGCGGNEFEENYSEILKDVDCPDEVYFAERKCWKDCKINYHNVRMDSNNTLYYLNPEDSEWYGLRFECYPEGYEDKYKKGKIPKKIEE
ncbi:Non-catalytic module family DOC2 [Piromyces sp. E2]|nr:Non-catalytic module family DOC2 [Piromyces sp. E2]|eukprot:OUM58128.1 Non-catalytic module family DOC2 [Piromyces sp. E2]